MSDICHRHAGAWFKKMALRIQKRDKSDGGKFTRDATRSCELSMKEGRVTAATPRLTQTKKNWHFFYDRLKKITDKNSVRPTNQASEMLVFSLPV